MPAPLARIAARALLPSPRVHAALVSPLLAQVAYRQYWPGFWIFLGVAASVLGVILYLFFRSQPPSGPKMGE